MVTTTRGRWQHNRYVARTAKQQASSSRRSESDASPHAVRRRSRQMASQHECGDCGQPIRPDDEVVKVGPDWFHANALDWARAYWHSTLEPG